MATREWQRGNREGEDFEMRQNMKPTKNNLNRPKCVVAHCGPDTFVAKVMMEYCQPSPDTNMHLLLATLVKNDGAMEG